MTEQFTNKAETTLNGAINNSVTSLVVTSATGFPTTGDFRIIVSPDTANEEIMKVTAVSGTTFTVVRAAEAVAGVQTAQSHSNGATIAHVLTAGSLQDYAAPTGTIGCKVVWASGSLPGTGSYHSVPFSSEAFDTDGFHDNSTNNSRITIPAGLGGKYLVSGFYYNLAANELCYMTFKKNGSAVSPSEYAVSGDDSILNLTTVLDLNSGDYIELGVNAASSTNISNAYFLAIKLDSGRTGSGVGARVYNNAGQSISNTTSTAATFNSEDFDTSGFHDTGANTSRLTIPTGLAGKYIVGGGGRLASPGTGGEAWIRKNGSINLSGAASTPYSVADISVSTIVDLVAGDYLELMIYRDGGGSADFGHSTADERRATFWIMKLDSFGAMTHREADGSPTGVPNEIIWPDNSISFDGPTMTVRQVPFGFIGAKAYNSSTQSISASTLTALTLDSEEWDTDGFHSTSTNTSRMTIPAGFSGKYLVIAGTRVPNSGFSIGIGVNGTRVRNQTGLIANGTDSDIQTSTMVDVVGGDYIEVLVFDTTGGNVGHASAAVAQTHLEIAKLDSGRVGSGVGARVYNSTTQSINNNVFTFDSEEFDTDGFHSTSSNTSRLTIPSGLGGKYHIKGFFYTGSSTAQSVYLKLNGSTSIRGSYLAPEFGGGPEVIVDLVAGDYVEMHANGNTTFGHASALEAMNSLSIMKLDTAAGITYEEMDGSPTGVPTKIKFPNDSLTYSGSELTVRQVPYGFIGAKAVRTTTLSPTGDNTYRVITFDSEEFDTDIFHDNSTNAERMTIPTGMGGKYLVLLTVKQASDSGGTYITAGVRKNGSTFVGGSKASSSHDGNGYKIAEVSTIMDLLGGEYIDAGYITNSSSALGDTSDAAGTTRLSFAIYKMDAGRVGSAVAASVFNTANQNLTQNTLVYLNFDSEDYDTDGFHSTSSNTSRLTIPAGMAGKYRLTFYTEISDTFGGGFCVFRKNGTTYLGANAVTDGVGAGWAYLSVDADLVANDYVEVGVRVGNTGEQSIATDVVVPRFQISRIDSKPADKIRYAHARVATDQSRTSSTPGDLATVGPSVTVYVNTTVKITLSCDMYTNNSGGGQMLFSATGANTISAALAAYPGGGLMLWTTTADNAAEGSRVIYLDGLTPGTTTFTAKYAVYPGSVTANFRERQILVECLD